MDMEGLGTSGSHAAPFCIDDLGVGISWEGGSQTGYFAILDTNFNIWGEYFAGCDLEAVSIRVQKKRGQELGLDFGVEFLRLALKSKKERQEHHNPAHKNRNHLLSQHQKTSRSKITTTKTKFS